MRSHPLPKNTNPRNTKNTRPYEPSARLNPDAVIVNRVFETA